MRVLIGPPREPKRSAAAPRGWKNFGRSSIVTSSMLMTGLVMIPPSVAPRCVPRILPNVARVTRTQRLHDARFDFLPRSGAGGYQVEVTRTRNLDQLNRLRLRAPHEAGVVIRDIGGN